MKRIWLDCGKAEPWLDKTRLDGLRERGAGHFRSLFGDASEDAGFKGWLSPMKRNDAYAAMLRKAEEVRENAEVFVLVGVGGSNQAARAAIKALSRAGDGPEILYAGNTLSAHYIRGILDRIRGKSVYINVIAKNFETLEPGSHFRLLRGEMAKRYGREEMAGRVILTGTPGSRLEEIAKENGYAFLEFPPEVGGRYSALTPVGLFPMAVAGLNAGEILAGAEDMREELLAGDGNNAAVEYAAYRNCALAAGYNQEVLGFFEPRFEYFSRWWIQLFAESEGKKGKGIFPSAGSYSEDLHSLGQYMQDGRRNLLETFLRVGDAGAEVPVPEDRAFGDGFDYLSGKDFGEISRCAERATLEAHSAGGVPCAVVSMDRIDEGSMGALFYFFMVSCAVSGKLLGINPFDQEGVEEYKRAMFKLLGRPEAGSRRG